MGIGETGMKMTKEEARKEVERLEKYIAEYDMIQESDIEPFNIFMSSFGEIVLLPSYSTYNVMFILGGLCGDLGSAFSNKPMDKKTCFEYLRRYDYSKTNKALRPVEV